MKGSPKSLHINEWLIAEHDHDEIAAPACPACSGALTLHQPDPQLPETILGTCGDCKTWFLLDPALQSIQVVRKPQDVAPSIVTHPSGSVLFPVHRKRHA